jgi:thiamine biosynthesis lipoprotein
MILRLATPAMGTRFELALEGDSEVSLRAAGEHAIAEILEWDRRLSAFRPDSITSQLNREASSRPVPLDDQTFELLELCQVVWRDSGETFDPTVGPLMEAWRFREDAGKGSERAEPPSVGVKAAELLRDCERRAAAAMPRVGFSRVELAAGRVRFGVPGMRLDFGAVGKGWALDRAAEILRDADVTRALLHGGTSSVLAIGAPDGLPGFRVALALPAGSAGGALAGDRVGDRTGDRAGDTREHGPIFDLRDEGLGVSAPHGRSWTDEQGRPVGHVIDPRTGRPCAGAALAAVRGPSAALCDAWSTAALVIAGRPERMPSAYEATVIQSL